MYARHDSPKYLCRKCNNKLPITDLESIFHEQLKGFLSDPKRLTADINQAKKNLTEKEQLLANHQQAVQKVREEIRKMRELFLAGEITPQGHGEFYKPAEERLNQLVAELPMLQADIDVLKVNQLSAEDIMAEADTLYDRWPKLPIDDRRKIAEAVCEKIVIGKDDIDITLSCIPSSEELCKNQTLLCARYR